MSFEESPYFVLFLTVCVGLAIGLVVKCIRASSLFSNKMKENVEECIEKVADALLPGTKSVADVVEEIGEKKKKIVKESESKEPTVVMESIHSPTEIRK